MEQHSKRSLRDLRSIDWDLADTTNRDLLTDLHWHPARSPIQIPATMIALLSDPGETVLDPFCGSGTTIVAALRAGRHAVGIDLNPVSIEICEAKVLLLTRDSIAAYVWSVLGAVEGALLEALTKPASVLADLPNFELQARWYHERTLIELAAIWMALRRVGGELSPVGRVCFSAVLRDVSSQQKHWGWICDNVMPRELVYFDAVDAFARKLRFAEANCRLQSPLGDPAELICGDARDVLRGRRTASVDLVVSSPPYFGVTDYTKAQRLTHLWTETPIEPIRQVEIGARSKRRRLAGHAQYLAELEQVFLELSRVTVQGGLCVMVVGESDSRTAYIDEFRDIMTGAGFGLELDVVRRLPRRRAITASVDKEHVLVGING